MWYLEFVDTLLLAFPTGLYAQMKIAVLFAKVDIFALLFWWTEYSFLFFFLKSEPGQNILNCLGISFRCYRSFVLLVIFTAKVDKNGLSDSTGRQSIHSLTPQLSYKSFHFIKYNIYFSYFLLMVVYKMLSIKNIFNM